MANKRTAPRNERAGGAKKAKRTNTKKQIQKAVAKAYNREKKALAKSLAGAGASAGIKAGKAMKKSSAQTSAQKAYRQQKANTMGQTATKTTLARKPITNTSARMEQKNVKRNLLEEHEL